VATRGCEVGIDVPNATVMTIESAERFVLSQLHQLRGRVARSQHPGFVCVFSSSNNPGDNERLKAFAEIQNGFELAEIDMRLRGPGNLFSTEQTGFPPLRIADLVRDVEVLEFTRAQATQVIESDPKTRTNQSTALAPLGYNLRYGEALQISDVG
jgi:ATP-dependent DNA helicase RecG